MGHFSAEEAQQLLHNKFVVVLGDSIQRSVYKDLVLLLQKDLYLSNAQLRSKGEFTFEHDFLIEGGRLAELNNGTKYREVRQYRTNHHLVRFYFLTRVYSDYLESILSDFKTGPQPDVLIINSCVWDVSRYGPKSMEEYKVNLKKMFARMDEVILPECLMVWNMTMPLAHRITGGFLISELQHLDKTLRNDIIEGNFYSATQAACHKFDVLDLHYHFRFDSHNRLKDGVHWNQIVHRKITQLLLSHIADAWCVQIPGKKKNEGSCSTESIDDALEWFHGYSASYSGYSKFSSGRDVKYNSSNAWQRFEEEPNHYNTPCSGSYRYNFEEEPQRYATSYRGLVYDENSRYSAPQQYSGTPSYQPRPNQRSHFSDCSPPASNEADNMEPYFYDDSPVLSRNYSLGYTSFEEQNVHKGNGSEGCLRSFQGTSRCRSSENSSFPAYNFGSFPHHTEDALTERRHGTDRYVMRRRLKSRESRAPYRRPQSSPSYSRY